MRVDTKFLLPNSSSSPTPSSFPTPIFFKWEMLEAGDASASQRSQPMRSPGFALGSTFGHHPGDMNPDGKAGKPVYPFNSID